MKKVAAWIIRNKAFVAFVAAAVVVAGIMVAVSGCTVEDWVRVRVPDLVQEKTTAPAVVTLSRADPGLLEEWRAQVNAELTRYRSASREFTDAIAHGRETAGFLRMWLNVGLAEASASGLSAVPGGALLLAFLTGLAGLYKEKPGTEARIRTEKEASHKHGRKTAIEDILRLNGTGAKVAVPVE